MAALRPPADAGRGLLIEGDNLVAMPLLPPGAADLIVTDPPFASGRRRPATHDRRPGRSSAARRPAPDARRPRLRAPAAATAAPAGPADFDDRWPDPDAYLRFLRPRLAAMRDLLSARGSLVVHLDYRAVHAVKLELDRLFGPQRFINEIIWHYTGGGRARRYFSRKHDSLLWYAKSARWVFNIDAVRVPYKPSSGYARGGIVAASGKRYRPHPAGTPVDDVWDIPMINPLSGERCGFPAQKPEALLERLVLALSRPGDLVVDPFCGSGTALVVAARCGRRWTGCDRLPQAVALSAQRLADAGFAAERVGPLGERP